MSDPGPTSLTFEPLFAAAGVVTAVMYARAARRHRPGGLRIASFTAGLLLIVVALNSPLETLAVHYLLLAHLVQNALIADVAPPLLLLGLSRPMWAAGSAALPRPLHALANLGLALMVWLATWYLVHLAAFYDYALRHPAWLNLEHALLIFAGLVFWAPVVGARWWDRSPAIVVPYLLAAFVAASFLGLAFTFIPHPFYDYYVHVPRLDGISPTEDQNLAGIAMSAEQSFIFLGAIAYILILLADREQERAEADEAGRSHGA
ncbi:MAG TPA: cytochrome c oxidase assembly protein [Gaiellales bacterium]|jgi:cytochrome c oxidase assembly factor CtaG|nr:cytochrome c oxidase assembly protein [Gaiellales bacterium]